jgi:hypothetical protein
LNDGISADRLRLIRCNYQNWAEGEGGGEYYGNFKGNVNLPGAVQLFPEMLSSFHGTFLLDFPLRK